MKKQDFYNLGTKAFHEGRRVDGWSTSSWQGKAARQGWEDAKAADTDEARIARTRAAMTRTARLAMGLPAKADPNPCHMVCVEPVRVPPVEKTLNQQVAELLAVDLAETPAVTALLEKLGADEEGDGGDHACCWRGYIKDHFPAGGLWLELDKWKDAEPESDAYRLHHPDVVAYMLDNDGDTPDHIDELLYGEVRYVEVDGSKYSFDDHHVQYLEEGEEDKRGNYEFWFYHRLAEPDAETVKQLIISQTAFEANREAAKEAAQNAN